MHDREPGSALALPSLHGTIRVLLVEDNPGDTRMFRELLADSVALSFEVHVADTLEGAFARLAQDGHDVVVSDLSLPDSEGLETFRRLALRCEGLPVVVLTGNEDEELALQVLREGAHGCLSKAEVGTTQLVRTLWHAIERQRLSAHLAASHEREQQLATHDGLTALPNRTLFTERLRQAAGGKEGNGRTLAVLIADIDRLRRFNERFGHSEGDELLRQVAGRLQACVRQTETLARVGGDEFGIALSGFGREIDAARVAQRVLSSFATPVQVGGQPCVVTASVGIAIYPHDGRSAEALVSSAESALYHAKRLGGHRYEFYRPELSASAEERLDLENELRRALEGRELVAHFQPKVDARAMRVRGTEALVRWQHPERGLIPPGKFIPIAEETGLIAELGDWVLGEACRQGKRWQDQGLPGLPVSVNVSARQFDEGDFADRVLAALAESGLGAASLELEVTESTLMQDLDEVAGVMRALKGHGVRFSIDDFGTGYSSLAVLRTLPVDLLKIDRAFVKSIADDERDGRLAGAIVTLAHGLGLETVAEGVETPEQAELLCEMGCGYLQGFLFSQPLPADALEPLLRRPEITWKPEPE